MASLQNSSDYDYALIQIKLKYEHYNTMDNTMDEFSPELPVELWQAIFSKLSFFDQKSSRLVNKLWMEIITVLPEFRKQNCLYLEYCTLDDNVEPVSILKNSNLQYGSLVVEDKANFQLFSSLPTFLSRISATVTHLNVNVYSHQQESLRVFAENLSHLTVLHHLEIVCPNQWIEAATSFGSQRTEGGNTRSSDTARITEEMVEESLERQFLNDYKHKVLLKQYKNLISNKIKEDLGAVKVKKMSKTTEGKRIIAQKIQESLEEVKGTFDLTSRINTSVRILSFRHVDNILDIDEMLVFVPNVQEIYTKNCNSFELSSLLERHPEKVSSITVKSWDVDGFAKFKLCNLKHVHIKRHFKELADRFLTLWPSIETFNFSDIFIPDSHFNHITELSVFLHPGDYPISENGMNDLQPVIKFFDLSKFKNLHEVNLYFCFDAYVCYFTHTPVILDSIKHLKLTVDAGTLCSQCTQAMFESLTNLRVLTVFKVNCFKQAFRYIKNLEILQIEGINTFDPSNTWQEMKKLRTFILKCQRIKGSRGDWNRFARKLTHLKYLEVFAHDIETDDSLADLKASLPNDCVTDIYIHNR